MRATTLGDLKVSDLRERYDRTAMGRAYSTREADKLELLIIHHDAVEFDPAATVGAATEIARIDSADVTHQHNDWPAIAYHYYVFPSGRIYYVGDWNTVRYHTAGPDDSRTPQVISTYNERGIAIALAGNFDQASPPDSQLAATRTLVAELQRAFGKWFPTEAHRNLWPHTDCPGETWDQWKDQVTVAQPTPAEDHPSPGCHPGH